ncbi:MAG TPA: T9SS type A sorting domain-containing protein, partial [Candidatus Cloacimonadota bacterium]|nr:T9SS type A sorting domain-containing protein [Candidatus Cloacimonadota bacterium]
SPLAAQYNPNYRVTQRTQYQGAPGVNPMEIYYYHYEDTAALPDSIFDAVSYGTNQHATIEYNDLGLKQEMRFFNSISQGSTGYYYQIEYDDENRPISHHKFLYAPNNLAVLERNYYFYTDERLTMIYHWEHYAPSDPWYVKSVINYDFEGNPVEELRHTGTDSLLTEIDLDTRRVWTYENGRRGDLMAKLDAWANQEYSIFVTSLHPTHQPTTEIRQQLFYPDWLNIDKREYFYDDDNRLIQIKLYSAMAGNWVLAKVENLIYGPDGNLLYHYGNMSDWVDEYVWELCNPSSTEAPDLPQKPLELSFYPHPFAGEVNVSIKGTSGSSADLEIFNLKGEKLRNWRVRPGEQVVWDGKDLRGADCASGIYLIRARQDGATVARKLIRSK